MTANPPSMTRWEAAWRDKDATQLMHCYAHDAIVLHPTKPPILGRDAIGAFFQGGLDRVALVFHPTILHASGDMAFEWGTFQDLDRQTGHVIATGAYVVTWVRRDDAWLIQGHAWNSVKP